jgi:hypothetical protein
MREKKKKKKRKKEKKKKQFPLSPEFYPSQE